MAQSSQHRLRESLEDAIEDLDLDASGSADIGVLEELLADRLELKLPRDSDALPFREHLSDDEYLHILATTVACQELDKASATDSPGVGTVTSEEAELTAEQKTLVEECSAYLQQDYERRRQQMYQRLEVLRETFGCTDTEVPQIVDDDAMLDPSISDDLVKQFLQPSARSGSHVARPDTATGTTDRGGRVETSESRKSMPAFQTEPKKKVPPPQSPKRPNKSAGSKTPKSKGKGKRNESKTDESSAVTATGEQDTKSDDSLQAFQTEPKKKVPPPQSPKRPNKSSGTKTPKSKGKGKQNESKKDESSAVRATGGQDAISDDVNPVQTGPKKKVSPPQSPKHPKKSTGSKTPKSKSKGTQNESKKDDSSAVTATGGQDTKSGASPPLSSSSNNNGNEGTKDQEENTDMSSEKNDKQSGEAKPSPSKKKNNRNRKRKPKNTNATAKSP